MNARDHCPQFGPDHSRIIFAPLSVNSSLRMDRWQREACLEVLESDLKKIEVPLAVFPSAAGFRTHCFVLRSVPALLDSALIIIRFGA